MRIQERQMTALADEEEFWDEEAIHEECGVFGMYDLGGGDVASSIYYGLFALQHRGQESCGIAVSDTKGPKGRVKAHKGMGLCNELFYRRKLYPGECPASGVKLHKGHAGPGP